MFDTSQVNSFKKYVEIFKNITLVYVLYYFYQKYGISKYDRGAVMKKRRWLTVDTFKLYDFAQNSRSIITTYKLFGIPIHRRIVRWD